MVVPKGQAVKPPLLQALLQLSSRRGRGEGRAVWGKEAALCRESCQACGHTKPSGPGCRAGREHPPDSQPGRQQLLSLPRWKERVKAGAAEQPSASM